MPFAVGIGPGGESEQDLLRGIDGVSRPETVGQTERRRLAEFSGRQFRNALGRFATGVTVVTTMTENGPLAMTVNSFASVSLSPPLVLWSPARESDRFPAFEVAPYFAIHILAREQESLSIRFAASGDDFDGVDFAEGLGRSPILPDCAAVFECRHAAGHDGGDHLIVVGEVLRISEREAAPLLYYRGGYADLAHR